MQKVDLKITNKWSIRVCSDWARIIGRQIEMPYFTKLISNISESAAWNRRVPSRANIMHAFEATSFNDVKVVIMGQEPYPQLSQASGLAFGVDVGTQVPRTLCNIIQEVERELNKPKLDDKKKLIVSDPITLNKMDVSLNGWANQGVLLVNALLTGAHGINCAHCDMGWETFTDEIITALKHRNKPIVFIFWGDLAREKISKLIEDKGNGVKGHILALESSHPNPISYNKGEWNEKFLCCDHFLKANKFLESKSVVPIDWSKTGG